MSIHVTSIACHTCGAGAKELDGGEFTCAYCGTRNIITQRFQSFVESHRRFFEGPASLTEPLAALVHALEQVRSYTTRQVQDLTSSLSEVEDASARVRSIQRQTAESKTHLQNTVQKGKRDTTWGVISLVVLLVAIVLCIAKPNIAIAVGIMLVVGAIATKGEALWIALAVIGHLFVTVFHGAKGASVVVKGKSKLEEAEAEIKRVDESTARTLAEHRRHVRDILGRHSVMLREIGTFLVFRQKYDGFKDDLPIGVQTDEVLSQLNDMQFGSIMNTLETCHKTAVSISKEYDVKVHLLPTDQTHRESPSHVVDEPGEPSDSDVSRNLRL